MTGEEGGDALAKVAGAIADGTPVDWVREREAAEPAARDALDQLSVVERIRDMHSGVPTAIESTVEVPVAQTPPAIAAWRHLLIRELLGFGAWGEVYRAFDPTLQRDVALKLLRFAEPEAIAAERFLSEARRLARVHHSNIVTVYGADVQDGRYGIWFELIRGSTLHDYVTRHGPLSPREAAGVGLDLCRALSAMHGAGLVHRDLKAGNVMREEGGRMVLMDFGSGAELRPEGPRRASFHIYGTPIVMAPEQLRGEDAGPATDIYGLGALLYWLVSQKYPIEANDYTGILLAHERHEYVPLRDRRADLPSEFIRVVERAIAPDPKDRFASAGGMERALEATLPPPRPWWRRLLARPGLLWPGVATAGALVVTAILIAHSRMDEGKKGVAPHPNTPGTGGGVVAPRASLTATASLRRLATDGEEVVTAGTRVRPGDRISMLLEGSDRMYVYVLDEDETGNVFVLFPIPGLQPDNPLSPSVRHHLPGAMGDSTVYWRVTNAGGREAITTVASRQPLEQLEREIARFPRAVRGRPIAPNSVSKNTIGTLRGMGGISVEPPSSKAARRSLAEAIKTLEEKRVETGDVWIWTTELENPRP